MRPEQEKILRALAEIKDKVRAGTPAVDLARQLPSLFRDIADLHKACYQAPVVLAERNKLIEALEMNKSYKLFSERMQPIFRIFKSTSLPGKRKYRVQMWCLPSDTIPTDSRAKVIEFFDLTMAHQIPSEAIRKFDNVRHVKWV